jgi:hypothetical protein
MFVDIHCNTSSRPHYHLKWPAIFIPPGQARQCFGLHVLLHPPLPRPKLYSPPLSYCLPFRLPSLPLLSILAHPQVHPHPGRSKGPPSPTFPGWPFAAAPPPGSEWSFPTSASLPLLPSPSAELRAEDPALQTKAPPFVIRHEPLHKKAARPLVILIPIESKKSCEPISDTEFQNALHRSSNILNDYFRVIAHGRYTTYTFKDVSACPIKQLFKPKSMPFRLLTPGSKAP